MLTDNESQIPLWILGFICGVNPATKIIGLALWFLNQYIFFNSQLGPSNDLSCVYDNDYLL